MDNTNINELYAYIIVSNEYIHEEQIRYLSNKLLNSKQEFDSLMPIFNGEKILSSNELERLEHIFAKFDEKKRKDIYKKMLRLACCDGRYDEYEKNIISKLSSFVRIKHFSEEEYTGKQIKRYNRKMKRLSILARIKMFLYKSERINPRLFIDDAGQTAYIAKEMKQCLNSLEDKNVTHKKMFQDTKQEIEQIIKEYEQTENKNNYADVTVSLVGRTQAGKSTFFSILSKTGTNFIGEGRQRTTRYKRAFHMNGIRFIDTPGLAAAIDGGNDERIAMDALRGTDLVVFITRESPKDITLSRLEEIVNKKIRTLCVINQHIDHDYIEDSELRKTLYNDDMDWEQKYETTGTKNKIARYANNHNFEISGGIMASIFHLALVSNRKLLYNFIGAEQAKKYKIGFFEWRKLRKVSKIDEVFHKIYVELSKSSDRRKFRRYSFADDTAVDVTKRIEDLIGRLDVEIRTINDNKDNINTELETLKQSYMDKLDSYLIEEFSERELERIINENRKREQFSQEIKSKLESAINETNKLIGEYTKDAKECIKINVTIGSQIITDNTEIDMKWSKVLPVHELISLLEIAISLSPAGLLVDGAETILPMEKIKGNRIFSRIRKQNEQREKDLSKKISEIKNSISAKYEEAINNINERCRNAMTDRIQKCSDDRKIANSALENMGKLRTEFQEKRVEL